MVARWVRATRTAGLVAAVLVASSSCAGGSSPSTPVDPVASIDVRPADVEVRVGDTLRLTAVPKSANGSPLLGRSITWSSDRPEVARVDFSGLVTATAAGAARITARSEGRTRDALVRVALTPSSGGPRITGLEPEAIQAGWGDFTLTVHGEGFPATARVRFNGLPLESVVIDSTRILATVSSAYVRLEGTAEVTVEVQGPVPVSSSPVTFLIRSKPAFDLELLVAGNTVFVENRVRLDAVARDQFGAVIEGKSIAWTSSDSTVARIEAGFLRGIRSGSTQLTVSAHPLTRTVTYHVLSPPAADVLFVGAASGLSEIYLRSLRPGGGVTRLLAPGTVALRPAATRSGDRIAYVASGASGRSSIWVVGRGGTQPTQVTDDAGSDDEPVWSPDGQRLAYQSSRDGKSDIWVVRADGASPTNLTYRAVFVPEEVNQHPDWSPDGQRIVFSRGFGLGSSLYTIRPDGSDLRLLVDGGSHDLLDPAWSPDGSTIAYRRFDRATGTHSLNFARAATGTAVTVPVPMPVDPRAPAWLDDAWLAVASRALPGDATRTIALLRLDFPYQVVPMSSEDGTLAAPARLVR